jgi:hypothetical protein
MTDSVADVLSDLLPSLASAGFDSRRHGTLRVAVCDTDFLMNEVKTAAHPSTSLLAGFTGINVRAYAAQHVFDELYGDDGHGHPTKWHKLSEQAGRAGAPMPATTFREVFESRFLPDLSFVRMGDLFTDHPLVAAVRTVRSGRGTSDAPTAQLGVLLSRLRPVAYSHDEHLYKPGVAPRPRYLPAVRSAEHQVTRGEHFQVGAVGLASGSIVGVDYLAHAIGSRLGAPVWLSRTVMIGLVTGALLNAKRRAAVGRMLVPIGEAFIEHLERTLQGLAALDAASVAVEPLDRVECRLAEALIRRAHNEPLLAKEIQEELRQCDPHFSDVPTLDELRGVLNDAPCFEEGPRWRYRLGHRYEQRT